VHLFYELFVCRGERGGTAEREARGESKVVRPNVERCRKVDSKAMRMQVLGTKARTKKVSDIKGNRMSNTLRRRDVRENADDIFSLQ